MRLRYVSLTVVLFVFLGGILEFSAFVIGLAFSGVNDFGRGVTLPFACIYFLGLWGPDSLLPQFTGEWADLLAPIICWGVLGIPVGFWFAARKNRQNIRSV